MSTNLLKVVDRMKLYGSYKERAIPQRPSDFGEFAEVHVIVSINGTSLFAVLHAFSQS